MNATARFFPETASWPQPCGWDGAKCARLLSLLAYCALLITCVARHEIWRDEAAPWLFARDSSSLRNLASNLSYETHPRLWYVLLYAITRFTGDPVAMQVLHVLIAVSAAIVILWMSPLQTPLRCLFVFGYYPLYEFGVISRNYSIGILAIFAACVLLSRKQIRWITLASLLFVATQANHCGMLLVLAIVIWVAAGLCMDWKAGMIGSERVRGFALFAAISLSGVLLSMATARPQPDQFKTGLQTRGLEFSRVMHTFGNIWYAAVPVPSGDLINAWLSNDIAEARTLGDVPGFLGMMILALSALTFRRHRQTLTAYAAGTLGLMVLLYFKTGSGARHYGHFFILYVVCLWLAHIEGAQRQSGAKILGTFGQGAFATILLLHVAAGAALLVADWKYPFSQARNVARYLKDNGLEALPIVGDKDYALMPLSALLKRKIFYAATKQWGSFIVERNDRKMKLSTAEQIEIGNELAMSSGSDVLLILNHVLLLQAGNQLFEFEENANMRRLRIFSPSMVGDESYAIYRIVGPSGEKGTPDQE